MQGNEVLLMNLDFILDSAREVAGNIEIGCCGCSMMTVFEGKVK